MIASSHPHKWRYFIQGQSFNHFYQSCMIDKENVADKENCFDIVNNEMNFVFFTTRHELFCVLYFLDILKHSVFLCKILDWIMFDSRSIWESWKWHYERFHDETSVLKGFTMQAWNRDDNLSSSYILNMQIYGMFLRRNGHTVKYSQITTHTLLSKRWEIYRKHLFPMYYVQSDIFGMFYSSII